MHRKTIKTEKTIAGAPSTPGATTGKQAEIVEPPPSMETKTINEALLGSQQKAEPAPPVPPKDNVGSTSPDAHQVIGQPNLMNGGNSPGPAGLPSIPQANPGPATTTTHANDGADSQPPPVPAATNSLAVKPQTPPTTTGGAGSINDRPNPQFPFPVSTSGGNNASSSTIDKGQRGSSALPSEPSTGAPAAGAVPASPQADGADAGAKTPCKTKVKGTPIRSATVVTLLRTGSDASTGEYDPYADHEFGATTDSIASNETSGGNQPPPAHPSYNALKIESALRTAGTARHELVTFSIIKVAHWDKDLQEELTKTADLDPDDVLRCLTQNEFVRPRFDADRVAKRFAKFSSSLRVKRIASILEELEISASKLDSLQRRLEDPGHTAHGNDPLVGIRDIRSRKIKILDVGIVKDAAAPNRGDQHLEYTRLKLEATVRPPSPHGDTKTHPKNNVSLFAEVVQRTFSPRDHFSLDGTSNVEDVDNTKTRKEIVTRIFRSLLPLKGKVKGKIPQHWAQARAKASGSRV